MELNFRNKNIHGDVTEVIKNIPDGVYQTVVTSPPYYCKRDYKVPPTQFPEIKFRLFGVEITVPAWTGCYGLEPTPEMYVAHTVHIFREVKRVLRPDGTCWINIGDTYCTTAPGTTRSKLRSDGVFYGLKLEASESRAVPRPFTPINMKPKDLMGIPWMVAFALREDGWCLRQDIIWSKRNTIPESVTDRCTQSHEYIFLLSKADYRKTYWIHRDGHATRKRPKPEYRWLNTITNKETNSQPEDFKHRADCPTCSGTGKTTHMEKYYFLGGMEEQRVHEECQPCSGTGNVQIWRKINLWTGYCYFFDAEAIKTDSINPDDNRGKRNNRKRVPTREVNGIRNNGVYPKANKRSVWTVSTKGYSGTHFATYPAELVLDCIKAGSSEYGCCADCGAPYQRMDKKKGWQKTCSCTTNKILPCVVLDPFGGTGTTARVAKKLGRDFTGIELNPVSIKETEQIFKKEFGIFI